MTSCRGGWSLAVAQVRARATGIVQQRLFTEGSAVQVGQPLFRIDAAPYEPCWPAPGPSGPRPKCRWPKPRRSGRGCVRWWPTRP